MEIKKTSDLLSCTTIAMQIQNFGRTEIITMIAQFLNELSVGLDVEIAPDRLLILSADILDRYTYESLEDVKECFKKARRGFYGWGMEKRGSINMVVIDYWMNRHLEEKAIERLAIAKASQKEDKEKYPDIDYNAYKERMKKEHQNKQELTKKEQEYLEYRKKFIESRGKAE